MFNQVKIVIRIFYDDFLIPQVVELESNFRKTAHSQGLIDLFSYSMQKIDKSYTISRLFALNLNLDYVSHRHKLIDYYLKLLSRIRLVSSLKYSKNSNSLDGKLSHPLPEVNHHFSNKLEFIKRYLHLIDKFEEVLIIE